MTPDQFFAIMASNTDVIAALRSQEKSQAGILDAIVATLRTMEKTLGQMCIMSDQIQRIRNGELAQASPIRLKTVSNNRWVSSLRDMEPGDFFTAPKADIHRLRSAVNRFPDPTKAFKVSTEGAQVRCTRVL